jgi:stage II sporulation protein D
MKIKILLSILLSFPPALAGSSLICDFNLLSSQVRVRIFAEQKPAFVIFTVISGKYKIATGESDTCNIIYGESVVLSCFNGKIFFKTRNVKGLLSDSVKFKGLTGDDNFSLRINSYEPVKRYYSGDLQCFHDLETLLIINICDMEKYIAGVVKTEGGTGRNEEYFKTQAVIARTYTCKYLNKHINDRYNLCDGTHCQAFHGVTEDSVIIKAVLHTKDLVIVSPDSTLIISAFHSNCGGETSPSEYVWITSQPYLKRVVDPYCLNSRNATWEKTISVKEWTGWLVKNGYSGNYTDPSVFNFAQSNRLPVYSAGSFSLPLQVIRTGLGLRSSFFSVLAEGDSLLLKGRGYGHGVGLCQEGAMEMALKGFDFREIISFYYTGVNIISIENARITENEEKILAN